MARTAEEAAQVIQDAGLAGAALHVFPRLIGEDGVTAEVWARLDAVADQVRAALPGTPTAPAEAVDLILGEENEPWFLGAHRLTAAAHPCPGALPRLEIPAEAPSRAWLKMEQALAWLGLDDAALAGKTAVELGSAPGGSTWSLLQRGVEVIGADTGIMDERVMSHRLFTHLKMPAADVTPEMVPERVDLVASDMNLAPEVVLAWLEPMCRHLQPRWLVLTFKVNDQHVEAQLPRLIDRVRTFAPGPVYARQLHANRREVTVVSARA